MRELGQVFRYEPLARDAAHCGEQMPVAHATPFDLVAHHVVAGRCVIDHAWSLVMAAAVVRMPASCSSNMPRHRLFRFAAGELHPQHIV